MSDNDVRSGFEEWFSYSRRHRGMEKREALLVRAPSGDYVELHTQRHWWTWQNAVAFARGIGAEGRDPQGLGAKPAEPGPQGAPKEEP